MEIVNTIILVMIVGGGVLAFIEISRNLDKLSKNLVLLEYRIDIIEDAVKNISNDVTELLHGADDTLSSEEPTS
jgi:hypothetical protein